MSRSSRSKRCSRDHLERFCAIACHGQLMVERKLLQGQSRQHDIDAQIVDQENIFHPAC
jgi:hypothetical protein